MLRRVLILLAVVGAVAGSASAAPTPRTFASAEIATVLSAGLMSPSVGAFRPEDPLTASELATAVAGLGGVPSVSDPYAPVSVRELDAQLVSLVGLRQAARTIRLTAVSAGLSPRPWLGTETIARMLGLRTNHAQAEDQLELQISQPVTRAEAAYSFARYLALGSTTVETARSWGESFTLPPLSEWQRLVLARALRLVGSPYVFAGTSERPQQLFGRSLPGGFDCSGLVWRVFKQQPFAGAPELSNVLVGRTTYEMSGEVARSARVSREALRPGDVVFFGARGLRSAPSEVGHMGIYLGNGWMVHSSGNGTTMTPMTGWYDRTFAWGRSPLVEAGLEY